MYRMHIRIPDRQNTMVALPIITLEVSVGDDLAA